MAKLLLRHSGMEELYHSALLSILCLEKAGIPFDSCCFHWMSSPTTLGPPILGCALRDVLHSNMVAH